MIAHATARVLKANTVNAQVKPTLTISGNVFKDLNGNGQLDAVRGLAPASSAAR